MNSSAQTSSSIKKRWADQWGRLLHREESLGYFMVSPALVFLALMLAYPLFLAIYLSFTDKRLGSEPHLVGFKNFVVLFQSSLYWITFKNSMVYTIIALVLKFVGGLALAQLLNREFIGKRLARAALLLPWIVPTVFSTLAWWWMLDPANSILNVMLRKWGIIRTNLPFLMNPTWAMGSLIVVNVWRGVPFFAITFLAALQSVSEELIDAAKIDGANGWQRFWQVVFPLIVPVVIVVVLMSTISTVSDFELPYLLTRGGPRDGTMVFGILTFNYAMGSGLIGLGSAVSVTMLPILAVLTIQSLLEVRRSGA